MDGFSVLTTDAVHRGLLSDVAALRDGSVGLRRWPRTRSGIHDAIVTYKTVVIGDVRTYRRYICALPMVEA